MRGPRVRPARQDGAGSQVLRGSSYARAFEIFVRVMFIIDRIVVCVIARGVEKAEARG